MDGEDKDPGLGALMHVAVRPPVVMVRGEGSFLWDESGRRYLDFVQGWAVNALGHAPPVLARALAEQSTTLVNASPGFHTRAQLDFAAELVAVGALDRVFLCSTGAEANEGAIKLVRRWASKHRPGAFEILTTEGSFHGRTLATMSASGKPGFDALFPPKVPGFRKVPFADLGAVERAINEETAAVMVEPIQGEAGVVVPPEGYLRELRALTAARGILLVLDEVQTGVGRTGTLFRYEAENARPDILTLGKGLGGGVPLAALCATEAVSCFEP
ncbi:MAG: aminotransferase class III-fold pyridoxal phosphate-dependent enzyme, partial [Polyangiaceae bacterium]|nr:aminotransferase class III-fold pyridoxal phosphate-dependent enzyme [Polyangiaceae bacterium]